MLAVHGAKEVELSAQQRGIADGPACVRPCRRWAKGRAVGATAWALGNRLQRCDRSPDGPAIPLSCLIGLGALTDEDRPGRLYERSAPLCDAKTSRQRCH